MRIASRSPLFLGGLAALVHFPQSAAKITFINSCDRQINLYDNAQEVPMAPGASQIREAGDGFRGMFRAGRDPQATLAEFTCAGGKLWYDISIIPTSSAQGPEYCPSLDACKQFTGGTGYNEPMQIAPQSNINGAHCRVLTCLSDGCDDAYQFPKDDTKTHNCPSGTDFLVTFCPGGPGGATPAPTPAPVTTAPPTPVTTAPPTPAPTVAPTTQPPIALASGSNATASDVTQLGGEVAGDADNVSSSSGSGPSESGQLSADAIAVVPVAAAVTPVPISSVPAATTAEPALNDTPATEANTQSNGGSGSNTASILAVGAFGLAAAVGVAAVVVVRRKQRDLDAQTDKSPIMNPGLATL